MGGLSFKQSLGLVVFWYCVTLVFNWTAFNLVVLKDDPALALIPNDITLIEMFACTICGALTLYSKGLAFVPPPEVRTRMLALAITNAAACQLFMIAMDYVALSLVQTIRACQPLFTVVVVYVCFNESYSATTYATLIPICLGFALAAGGDPKFEQTGFALAVTSTCCLVAVNTISRRTLAVFRSTVSPLQVQAWATSGSFYLLLAPWCFTGGPARLQFALSGLAGPDPLASKSAELVGMVVADGLAYHAANVGTFTSIDTFNSLTFAIIDTLRRLLVVCSGFVYQGNPCTIQNMVGIVLVIFGAGCYNVLKDSGGDAAEAKPKGTPQKKKRKKSSSPSPKRGSKGKKSPSRSRSPASSKKTR